MKLVSTMALGMALAMGGAAMLATPVTAAKKESGSAPQLSANVRTALVAAQAAQKNNDGAGMTAALQPVVGSAQTPDDKLYVGQMLYQASQITKDAKAQSQGVDLMIASGKYPNVGQLYTVKANTAYQAKDYASAEAALQGAVKAGVTEPDVYAMLAESQAKLNRPADAVATLQAASDAAKAKGQKLPADFYGRAISIGYNAKLAQPVNKLSLDWVTNYPTPDNWRDALEIYRTLNHVDAETDLDISRLQRAAGALKGEKDYYDYINAIYQRYPAEAKAVIAEGVQNKFLNASPGGDIAQIQAVVDKRLVADKASLPADTAAALKSTTGKSAFVTGDAYLGYGNYAKAIELYRAALQKGGVDANVVNTRLGMALAMSGDKAGAKQAFGAVTGPRAQLAQYWMIWTDQKA